MECRGRVCESRIRRNPRQWKATVDHRSSAKRFLLPLRWNRRHAILSAKFVHRTILCATLLTHPLNYSTPIVGIFDIKAIIPSIIPKFLNTIKKLIPTSLKFLNNRSIFRALVLFENFPRSSRNETRRGANKICVTARVHSRFALLAWRAQSCSIVAVDNGLLSATATNWAPIIALMHQPRRARGVTVKLPPGPLAKKGRCYREPCGL